MSQHYKGRIVDPRAYELADRTGWTAEVYVAENVDDTTVDTQFFLKETFPTSAAALDAALAVGKREVDKRIQSSEVQDLFDQANKLPANSKHAGYGSTADIGLGSDGERKSVPRLKTPDDAFRS
jgi:hypothetical protein